MNVNTVTITNVLYDLVGGQSDGQLIQVPKIPKYGYGECRQRSRGRPRRVMTDVMMDKASRMYELLSTLLTGNMYRIVRRCERFYLGLSY